MKRYVHEKIRYIQESEKDEHVLIVPGAKTERVEDERSRVYTIASPLLSRTSRYRILLNLRAVEEILEVEMPDLIESGDPYQVAWKAIASGHALRIPVVGFYHSHFAEAYLRTSARFFGATGAEFVMDAARRYVRKVYNQFAATLVPSQALGQLLTAWGVDNVRPIDLGVDIGIFRPEPNDAADTRSSLGIPRNRCLLIYVGRLAAEKNTRTLFQAFDLLQRDRPNHYHLLVIGDGAQRKELERLREFWPDDVTWREYSTGSPELARFYRAADLLVHPGVQETFGLTSLESQACGTPVVGIRGSYMDRIIFGDQKHWATQNTPRALADAIARFGAQELEEMGAAAAKKVAARYSWPDVFGRLFCIYREVCTKYLDT